MISCQVKLILRPAQERQLRRWLWHLTAVYNWTIKKLEHEPRLSRFDVAALLNGHGTRIGIARDAVIGTSYTAYEAMKRYRAGVAGRPKLKGRRNRLNSIAFPHGHKFTLYGSRIKVPIAGRLRFHRQAIPAGHWGTARLICRPSGWYLCLTIQTEPKALQAGQGDVGIDPGFSHLLTLSTGQKIEHPHELRRAAVRLGQAQRGGRQQLAARLHERLANRRRNRNHHLSRQLVEQHRLIVFSKDRTKAIARTFGKSVASAGHYQLRHMLAYKSRLGGAQYIEVDSRYSTRTCSACGCLDGPTGWSGLKVRQWTCGCGATHDRDVNAAVNTLIAGRGTRHEGSREAVSGIAT